MSDPVHVAPTAALAAARLAGLRRMLDAAFDDFSADDWEHALGGLHVWIEDAEGIVSHAALVERTLVCSGCTLRVGYVEAVATAPARQRQGHGRTVMQRVGALIRERHPLGALSSDLGAFYQPLGWEAWRGPTFVAAPAGPLRTPDDDGGVMILRTAGSPRLDLDGDIVCDWRPGDVW
jgi:aminoglycoside 2'-N-acetyltransferase I